MRTCRRTRLAASTLACSAILFVVTGCGDDDDGSGSTASEEVCDARSDLTSSVQDVIDQIRAGNLGKARDELGDVGDDLRELGDALNQAGGDAQAQLSSEVDQLKSDMDSMGDVNSLSDLSARFDAVSNAVSNAASSIKDDFNCS